MDVLIGTLLVIFVFAYRFGTEPPPRPVLPQGMPRALGMLRSWCRLSEPDGPHSALLPPPRANTTAFKFWLYRVAYVAVGVTVYLAIDRIPGLAAQLQAIVNFALQEAKIEQRFPALQNAAPVVLAFLVAVVLPKLPFFRGAEACLRRGLYDRAAIPAQQYLERNRLRN